MNDLERLRYNLQEKSDDPSAFNAVMRELNRRNYAGELRSIFVRNLLFGIPRQIQDQTHVMAACLHWIDPQGEVIKSPHIQRPAESLLGGVPAKFFGLKTKDLRQGLLSETTQRDYIMLHPRPEFRTRTRRQAQNEQSANAERPNHKLPDEGEGVWWEKGKETGNPRTGEALTGYLPADLVYVPQNPNDLLVLVQTLRPDNIRDAPDPDFESPGPYGAATTNIQHLFIWCQDKHFLMDHWFEIRWFGYSFRYHKAYKGAVSAHTKLACVQKFMSTLDVDPGKNKPVRRR